MDETNLDVLWKKFEQGDPLSDKELEDLIVSATVGLNYLNARGERFVSSKTILDLETLLLMKKWRGEER